MQSAVVKRLQQVARLGLVIVLIQPTFNQVARSAQNPLATLPSIRDCVSAGHFEAWSSSGQLILLDNNHFLECDLKDGTLRTTNYSPPRSLTFNELSANASKPLLYKFPDVIQSPKSSTGELVTWTHVAPLFFRYDDNYLPVENRLLSKDQGELAVYVAAPVDASHATAKPVTQFAFAYRKDAKYRMIEIEAQPHRHRFESGYPWGHLASSMDYTTGRVLLFFDGEALYPDTQYVDGWSPFNVWWFDPPTATLTHLVLPDGPWVKDADKPRIFSNLKNYPLGAGSTYEIKAAGGRIFVLIQGVLNESSLGIWMFQQPGVPWKKIANKGVDLARISPDGCKLAIDHAPSLTILDLCN